MRWPEWAAVLFVSCLGGCDACASPKTASRGADAGVLGLSPERAAQVLARVGDRVITLGDYARALERMDPFERMRYQTEDRRQALLDEMINVELLAREARRRGLDKQPETIELIRQFQRDEALRQLRETLPRSEELPAADVARYFAEHRSDFFEPERRRAAAIVLGDESLARRVVGQAAQAGADGWRKLVAEHNPDAVGASGDASEARPALDVPGDLGMVQLAPGGGSQLSEELRRAIFQIAEVGQVYPEPVAAGGRFHVLRLVSRVEARQRTLEEVDGAVRTRLLEARWREAETALLKRLRETIEVRVDEAALERVEPPPAAGAAGAGASGAAGSP